MPSKTGKNINKGVTLTRPAGPAQPVEPLQPGHASTRSIPGWSSWEIDQFKKLDYVRFTYADINGIGRCRSVPQRHLQEYLTQGVDIYMTGFFICALI